eukprot:5471979-Amphidinium_carterae.1
MLIHLVAGCGLGRLLSIFSCCGNLIGCFNALSMVDTLDYVSQQLQDPSLQDLVLQDYACSSIGLRSTNDKRTASSSHKNI